MLGTLLRVRHEVRRECVVLFRGLAARAGPGDGADVDPAMDRADMDFRRTTDEREIPHFQDEHVGRGIHKPQRPVEIDRWLVEIRLEALARDELENIPGFDEFLTR